MEPKKKKRAVEQRIDRLDIEELAASLCEIDDEDSEAIQQAFYDKFDIDFEKFEELMVLLFQRLDFGISHLSEEAYIGFSNKESGVWLVKKSVNHKFLNGILAWVSGGDLKTMTKAFSRDLFRNGAPEYVITLTRGKGDEKQESA